jgi:antitoxin YefM
MSVYTVSEARANLYKLLDSINVDHEPALIKGKRYNGVFVAESDWLAIQETFYLLSVPGMRESIVEGLNTPINETEEKLDW